MLHVVFVHGPSMLTQVQNTRYPALICTASYISLHISSGLSTPRGNQIVGLSEQVLLLGRRRSGRCRGLEVCVVNWGFVSLIGSLCRDSGVCVVNWGFVS